MARSAPAPAAKHPTDPASPAPPPSARETGTILPAAVSVGLLSSVPSLPEGASPDIAKAIAAYLLFLSAVTARREGVLRVEYVRRAAEPGDVEAALAADRLREAEFTRFAVVRLARDLPAAYKEGPPAVRRVLDRERRYTQQRNAAAISRIAAAVDRAHVRRISPTGAWWVLGHARDHTSGCVFLAGGRTAGSARFWPWPVLDRIHPPRHHGCTSILKDYGWGVQRGLYRKGSVLDVADAIRQTSHIVMEGADAERVAREIEAPALFDALLSYGVLAEADREGFLRDYIGSAPLP